MSIVNPTSVGISPVKQVAKSEDDEKINVTVSNDIVSDDIIMQIPKWDDLKDMYNVKWLKEKALFHSKLQENFKALTEQFRTGKQEIYQLNITNYIDRYIKAFRELFHDTGYQATVGEVERTTAGNKKFQKLYIVLPECM
jgi:hypothetical protein